MPTTTSTDHPRAGTPPARVPTAVEQPATEVAADGIAIHRARQHEAPGIAAALGQAFFDDPVMRWAIPDDGRRRRLLPDFFELFARTIQPYGETLVAGDAVGAALWVPPGRQAVGDDAEAFGRRMEQIAGSDAARMFEIAALLDEHHPHGSFFYLQFIGVQPDQQGRGIGAALLTPVLERCDRLGLPAYLEATSPQNRRLYERHGFQAAGDLAPLGGPPLWPMWRQPATA
jgi:GNAT superfamily N-acetyltransferase